MATFDFGHMDSHIYAWKYFYELVLPNQTIEIKLIASLKVTGILRLKFGELKRSYVKAEFNRVEITRFTMKIEKYCREVQV